MTFRPLRIGLLMLLLLAACTGGEGPVAPTATEPLRGGTLRIVTPANPHSGNLGDPSGPRGTLDPATEYALEGWEMLRCCLVRTLMAFPGAPGGDTPGPLPDLAASTPEVSADGLSWTFRLRKGIRYAPPMDDVEITAGDVVRALERMARVAGEFGYGFYYSPIQGFDAVAAGEAGSISGLETPDDHTVVVRLTRRYSDLPQLFTLPASAPVPANPADPSAPFGVAGPEEGYGRHLVASGPYMLEGSEELNLRVPPDRRDPVSGLGPGRITLVRNPAWRPDTDPLRPALSDRIEHRIVPSREAAFAQLEAGDTDLVFWPGLAPQPPEELIRRYQADPSLGRVEIRPRDFLFSITMNLAHPPFDDIRVRRAVNFAIDKQALIDRWGGHFTSRVATHLAADSVEANLLAAYDPFDTPGKRGSIAAAREEMAQSRYDRNRDGTCDALACRGLEVLEQRLTDRDEIGSLVRRQLARIGIDVRVTVLDPDPFHREGIFDPAKQVPLGIAFGWAKDLPSASQYLDQLFRSPSVGPSPSLVGATPEELAEWGYAVRSVPNVDARLDQCLAADSSSATGCWATLDRYLMEEVVPTVPFATDHDVAIIPKRVVAYSFSQMTTLPALDRIAVQR